MMLIAAAAKRWKRASRARCSAHDDAVCASGEQARAGVRRARRRGGEAAGARSTSDRAPPAQRARRTSARTCRCSTRRASSTGTAQFGADVVLPGMLIAVIARPPVRRSASSRARRDARARRARRASKVVELPQPKPPIGIPAAGAASRSSPTTRGPRCAGAPRSTSRGTTARTRATTRRPTATSCSPSVRAPGTGRAQGRRRRRGAREGREGRRGRVLRAAPRARPDGAAGRDRARRRTSTVEVWASTQNPQRAREEVARVLGVDEDNVTVHVTLLGGGFGRKSKADFVGRGRAALARRRARRCACSGRARTTSGTTTTTRAARSAQRRARRHAAR